MKQRIIPLFLPVLQMITGCLATIVFFVLIYNGSHNKSVIFVLAIAILGNRIFFKAFFDDGVGARKLCVTFAAACSYNRVEVN